MLLRNLTIGYPSRQIAADINLHLEAGRLTCLIGENGVGKSTLLRTLSGFLPPLSGDILIDFDSGSEPKPSLTPEPEPEPEPKPRPKPEPKPRHSLYQLSPKMLSRLIAVVLTDRLNLQNTTVRELVSMGRMPYTGFFGRLSAEDKDVVDECMQTVGVDGERTVSTLSDGERQKAMIARALAQQTRYIFLDEPTAFLDYPSKLRTMETLKKLARDFNKTIFLSTHDIEIALNTADTLVMMERDGVKTGTPKIRNHEKTLSFTSRDLLVEC